MVYADVHTKLGWKGLIKGVTMQMIIAVCRVIPYRNNTIWDVNIIMIRLNVSEALARSLAKLLKQLISIKVNALLDYCKCVNSVNNYNSNMPSTSRFRNITFWDMKIIIYVLGRSLEHINSTVDICSSALPPPPRDFFLSLITPLRAVLPFISLDVSSSYLKIENNNTISHVLLCSDCLYICVRSIDMCVLRKFYPKFTRISVSFPPNSFFRILWRGGAQCPILMCLGKQLKMDLSLKEWDKARMTELYQKLIVLLVLLFCWNSPSTLIWANFGRKPSGDLRSRNEF